MKITDRFIGDHKTFRKLIRDIQMIAEQPFDETAQRRLIRLVELFKDHLILHAWGEETFFYPLIKAHLPPTSPLINSAYMKKMDEEHVVIDRLIDQLERHAADRQAIEKWSPTFLEFSNALKAHMNKEENELFPFSEGLLGKQGLEKISEELERRRSEAPPIRRHSSF